jgi:hypothetical protein
MISEYNIFKGTKIRVVFVTCSKLLHTSFKEDLGLVAGNKIETFPNEHSQFPSVLTYGDGVLLVTYQHLARSTTSIARVNEISSWASKGSAPPMLVFDECHAAQNKESSTTGVAITRLLNNLPTSFRVFSSATLATGREMLQYLQVSPHPPTHSTQP